jgi:two-component system cell cycle sensor histidine kinase/response regulator CckA
MSIGVNDKTGGHVSDSPMLKGSVSGPAFPSHLHASRLDAPADSDTVANEVPGKEGTILVVDDEAPVVSVMKEIMESLGFRVYTAASGQEAVAIFFRHQETIDLVFLDMIMPGMSGEDTFEALRKINPDVKAVLASGYGSDERVRHVMERGCRGFIQKPFGIREISRKIREILNGAALTPTEP